MIVAAVLHGAWTLQVSNRIQQRLQGYSGYTTDEDSNFLAHPSAPPSQLPAPSLQRTLDPAAVADAPRDVKFGGPPAPARVFSSQQLDASKQPIFNRNV